MNSFSIVFSQICVMFIYMMMGLLFFKTGKISEKTGKQISTLLLELVIPCVLIESFMQPFSAQKLLELAESFLLGAIALSLAIVISHLFFKNRIDRFSSSFSNAGFMSIPLVFSVLGSEGVFYEVGFLALFNLIQWSYGPSMLLKKKLDFSPSTLIKNPMLIGILIGFVIFITGLGDHIPYILSTAISGFASLNGPLAMFVIGSYLAKVNFRKMIHHKGPYWVSLIRLIAIPALNLILFLFVPVPKPMRLAVFLAASAPVGANVAIYCGMFDLDYSKACENIVLSTLFSLLTMPVYFMLAQIVL